MSALGEFFCGEPSPELSRKQNRYLVPAQRAAVLVDVGNRLALRGSAIKLDVLNADPSVDDADVHTFTSFVSRFVRRKSGKEGLSPVTNTSETLQRKQCTCVMLELSARLSYN